VTWTRYLLHDFWTAEELNAIDRRFERTRRARMRSSRTTDARISELEDDVARLTLVVKALSEAVVAQGAVSREDLSAWLERIDLLDGVADGKLDPDSRHAAPGETEAPEEERPPAPTRRRHRRR